MNKVIDYIKIIPAVTFLFACYTAAGFFYALCIFSFLIIPGIFLFFGNVQLAIISLLLELLIISFLLRPKLMEIN